MQKDTILQVFVTTVLENDKAYMKKTVNCYKKKYKQ